MIPPPTARERFAWAMYDFANSGYTTVVLTAVFNAYFVGVVAGGLGTGDATALWTTIVAVGNAIVLLSAPVVGAIADHRASKKPFLVVATVVCVATTALLGAAVDAGLGREEAHELVRRHAVEAALAARTEPEPVGMLERLAADPRFPLDRAGLDRVVADPGRFLGLAESQVDAVWADVEALAVRHPAATDYTPEPIL